MRLKEEIEDIIYGELEHDAFGLHRVDEAAARICQTVRDDLFLLASEWEGEAVRADTAFGAYENPGNYSYLRGQACSLKRAARDLRERFGLDKGDRNES